VQLLASLDGAVVHDRVLEVCQERPAHGDRSVTQDVKGGGMLVDIVGAAPGPVPGVSSGAADTSTRRITH
jgi:hypothetical protein